MELHFCHATVEIFSCLVLYCDFDIQIKIYSKTANLIFLQIMYNSQLIPYLKLALLYFGSTRLFNIIINYYKFCLC